MKPKTLRYLAGAAIVPLAFEVLPHAVEETDECVANVSIHLCSGIIDPWATVPRDLHTPHQEFTTHAGGGYGWIASGQVVSTTSTGPSHGMPLTGESVASWVKSL